MKTKITQKPFGVLPDGREVTAYTLHSGEAYVTVLTLGGILHSIVVPDKNGNMVDVALGYDTPEEYVNNGGSIGVLCGRFANRIQGGRLTVAGKEAMWAITVAPAAACRTAGGTSASESLPS